jgi:Fe-Mn family superoxide dismutase
MPYPFEVPKLGYDYDALEPHFDATTMEIHHSKHHAGYTSKLNMALEGHADLHSYTAEQLLWSVHSLPEQIQTAVRNNGGGFANHKLFWQTIAPGGGGAPEGALGDLIDDAFDSFEGFTEAFSNAAATRFGSGWAWLALSSFGELKVFSTANQDSPLMQGFVPIVGLDVWEHAYYLKYQNRRPEYIEAFWNLVNWEAVGDQLAKALGGPAPFFKALEDFGREVKKWAEAF